MTLGSRIAQTRKQKGLTQSQFAKMTGVSASTVAMYETNRRSPDPTTLEKLAKALEVDADWLSTEPEDLQDGETEKTESQSSTVANKPRIARTSVDVQGPESQPSLSSSNNVTTFALSREEARLILFLRMNPDCAPFLESYMLAEPARRAQLEKTWRLIREFQV